MRGVLIFVGSLLGMFIALGFWTPARSVVSEVGLLNGAAGLLTGAVAGWFIWRLTART